MRIIYKSFALLAISLLLLPMEGRAEDVTATFINVQMKSGAVESVMLSNGVDYVGPRINRIEKKILINGQSFSPDEVEFITFEKRVVDGIEDVMASGQKRQTPQGVFDLQGRRVQNASEVDASVLPKGIYVVNGKKMVVK